MVKVGDKIRILEDKPLCAGSREGEVYTVTDVEVTRDGPTGRFWYDKWIMSPDCEGLLWEKVDAHTPTLTLVDNNPKARVGALKVPTQFVPPVAKLFLAEAMADGAAKYGPFNWRKEPVSASTYMGAMDRHLAAWFDGEDNAPDSGVHHLAHVMACCALVLDSYALGILVDDRATKGPSADFLAQYLSKKQERKT